MKKLIALSVVLFSIQSGAPVFIPPVIPEAQKAEESLTEMEKNLNELNYYFNRKLKENVQDLRRKAYTLQNEVLTIKKQLQQCQQSQGQGR